MAHLGCDHIVGGLEPELPEHARQHALGLAVAVDVGVVEMVHARVDRPFDRRRDVILVHVGPAVGLAIDPVEAAHRPAAEADLRYLDVTLPEGAVFHGGEESWRAADYNPTIHEPSEPLTTDGTD